MTLSVDLQYGSKNCYHIKVKLKRLLSQKNCLIFILITSVEVHVIIKPARSARARRACALRALGLLLADGTPTVGGGKTF